MDAHANEYAAAAQGMAEMYGSEPPLPAVGDTIEGHSYGKSWSGEVLEINERSVTVEVPGAWIIVPLSDIKRT